MAVIDDIGLIEYTKKIKSALTMVPLLIVSVDSGTEVIATCGQETARGTSIDGVVELRLPQFGDWVVYGQKNGEVTSSLTIHIETNGRYYVTLYFGEIYGVEWFKTSDPVWARTDDAEYFVDPVPYINQSTAYHSPFDELYPWKEISLHQDPLLGSLVKIPKYWFKWTDNPTSLKLQIANHYVEGFNISPAHAARFNGDSEKDYVYVSRYHCNSQFISQSGDFPVTNLTRAQTRDGISALGENIWQYDFAMHWTVLMLYLVEFAHFDCQLKIGYGCGNNVSKSIVGYTDNMPYHTGFMQFDRTTYGIGTQYRYIEGLWDNCFDWCDGIYFINSAIYVINDPHLYSDSLNGTYIGSRPTRSGYPIAYQLPSQTNYEYALFPVALGDGADGTYTCDIYYYAPEGTVLYVGGNFTQRRTRGLFYLNSENTTISNNNMVGCRLWKAGD